MKSFKAIIFWTVIVFGLVTFFTMQNEAASDGFDIYGFPLTFYDYTEGKCDNCYDNLGFKIFPFLIDILLATFFGFLITLFIKKLRKRN